MGTEATLEEIPVFSRCYVTIDIDVDPSIAPGTGTPSHGGFTYYEVVELLKGLAKRGDVVGVDLFEVAPDMTTPARQLSLPRALCSISRFCFPRRLKR
jgi:agmatinase